MIEQSLDNRLGVEACLLEKLPGIPVARSVGCPAGERPHVGRDHTEQNGGGQCYGEQNCP